MFLLQRTPQRRISRSPGRPPRAYATCWMISSQRLVSDERFSATRSKRWQKICCRHLCCDNASAPLVALVSPQLLARAGLSSGGYTSYDEPWIARRIPGRWPNWEPSPPPPNPLDSFRRYKVPDPRALATMLLHRSNYSRNKASKRVKSRCTKLGPDPIFLETSQIILKLTALKKRWAEVRKAKG